MKSGERWFQQVLDAMTEQIAVLDRHGTILLVNDAWQRFGRESRNADPASFGANFLEVCRRVSMHVGESSEEARRVLEGLRSVLEGMLDHFQHEYAYPSPTGRRWFVLTATPLTAGPGGAVITRVDVTSRKLREQEILRQADQDPLTGLANRRRIEAQAVQVLATARRSSRSAAVLAIDLDGFKAVNDTYGHHAGDLALRQIAARLNAKIRPPALLARLGGDEFVVLLPGADAREAEAAVEAFLSAFQRPLSIEGRKICLGASIGTALYPQQGGSFSELLQAADTAMYRVKSAHTGKSPVEGGERRGRSHGRGYRSVRRLAASRR